MFKYLALLAMFASSMQAYNILVVAPHPLVGHWLYVEEIIKELLKHGHHVTALTAYNVRRKHEHYSEVVIPLWNLNHYCEF